MLQRLKDLRIDLGEVISYYPCEFAVYKQKTVAGTYVAFFLRGAPDIIRLPFDSSEAREEFLTTIDAEMKVRSLEDENGN